MNNKDIPVPETERQKEMLDEMLATEYKRCQDDPRYFYNTYWKVNGQPVTPLSEEEWNERIELNQKIRNGIKTRK